MDLFTQQKENIKFDNAPLSLKFRPQQLADFVGQEHILGENKLLRRMILSDSLGSLIFYGPPGCGKTTLSLVIANITKRKFQKINAVTSNLDELRKVIKQADSDLLSGIKTILFIDEIHRFNKAQQDVLLPEIENGTMGLIGTTTLNPFFAINSAIISRCKVFELKKLTNFEIVQVLENALKQYAAKAQIIKFNDKALVFMANAADGDARAVLNSLEIVIAIAKKDEQGNILIDLELVQEVMQKKSLNYDKDGNEHYDTVSAFIKSMRGSDPDATLYWLAKMFYGGEDMRFIARRIVICAAEDVGNADPHALMLANSAAQAADYIGLPEAKLILAQAAVYIACAPKSNASYVGIQKAMEAVASGETQAVPLHLQDTHYKGAAKLNKGKGYQYPHDYEKNYVKQDYLVQKLKLYSPAKSGYENTILERLKTWQAI